MAETKKDSEKTDEQKNANDTTQVIAFILGKEEYGVEIHETREIIKKAQITRMPNAPEFVEGIINLRGRIIVVIDLLKKFGIKSEQKGPGSHIIISEQDGNHFGIIVDGVSEVMKIPQKDIRKTPGIIAARIHSDYIRGIGILDGGERLIILLDLQKILTDKEISKAGDATKTLNEAAHKEEERKKAKEENAHPKISDTEIESRFKEHFEAQKKMLADRKKAREEPTSKKENEEKHPHTKKK